LNAHSAINTSDSRLIRKFRISALTRIEIKDPRGWNGSGIFMPGHGPVEVSSFRNAPDRPCWFIFDLSGKAPMESERLEGLKTRGLHMKKWFELSEKGEAKIEELKGSVWEEIEDVPDF